MPNLEIESREACTGIIEVSSRAEAFASYIQSETKKWAKVIRDAKITDE